MCGCRYLSYWTFIQTRQSAPTSDPLVSADSAVDSYHAMKQLSGESINKYRIRMEDKVRISERLVLDVSP